ncbi:hypothetical protein QBZ16_002150 [Prototheca wickerhamii]|uniref:Uncharacterized protein n=1 Tax=Prototheca wickerhamii TaxID=3111 RepID=A0AAD9MLI1_PROWI|nr:hypothetical protein QBZ16_002150 [Prototheca wickerhamii]
MAESRGELDLYNQWFVLADADKDGVVSGGEAVQFFSKSGLPTNPTLFKIWQYVAGDRPSLNRQEFYTAMKLVSLAQTNSGVLDDQAALRLVNGLAGPIPPPRLAGLPQVGSFTTAFQQLDTDRDGLVQGVDCFGVFMRSGLPKAALKTVWDLVAGEAGALSAHQFVQALYLIEHAKAGRPLPPRLPAGPFPPVVAPLSAAERSRLEEERRALEQRRAEAEAAEAARAAAAARAKFFTDALAELRLAGSGISRALVERSSAPRWRPPPPRPPSATTTRRTPTLRAGTAAAAPAVKAAQAAAERRAGLATRLEALRATVAELESAAAPGARARDEEEAAALERELTALTVRRAALEAAAGSSLARRDELRARRAELRAAADEAQAALGPLQGEVAALVAASEPDRAALVAAMRTLAPLYDTLYRIARGAMLPLPAEALAGLKREALPLTYDGLLAAGAAEWGSFDDKGFTIVRAASETLQGAAEDVEPKEESAEGQGVTLPVSNGAEEATEQAFADTIEQPPPETQPTDPSQHGPRSPVPTPVDGQPAEQAGDDNSGILASAIAKALDVIVPVQNAADGTAGVHEGAAEGQQGESASKEEEPLSKGGESDAVDAQQTPEEPALEPSVISDDKSPTVEEGNAAVAAPAPTVEEGNAAAAAPAPTVEEGNAAVAAPAPTPEGD